MEPNFSLQTKFGKISYICIGFRGDPLILLIHGSGPTNSSKSYDFFLYEYLARVCFLRRFFIVAIDCPGYGKSEGSKQIVRSYPLELIEEVYKGLGYEKAFALFGHSQGGSAIFNAMHMKSSISEILIMDRPVCGEIGRFKNFKTPTLLIYDIEDDGHPISQGKLLHKNLSYSVFHTYRSSKTPFWIADNLWDVVLDFLVEYEFAKTSSNRSQSLNKRHVEHKIGEVEEEKRSWSLERRKKTNEKEKNKLNKEKSEDKNSFIEKKSKSDYKMELEEKKLEAKTQRKQDKIIVEKKDKKDFNFEKEEEKKQNIEMKEEKREFIEEEGKKIEEKEIKRKQKIMAEENYVCSLCLNLLFLPVTLKCKHSFCLPCLKDLTVYETRCPLCRGGFSFKDEPVEKDINQELNNDILNNVPILKIDERKRQAKLDEEALKKRPRLFVSFGHEFKELPTKPRANGETKKKYEWKLFVKQINFDKKRYIKAVEYDINYGSIGSKPYKVEREPFILEGKGGFSFTPMYRIFWNDPKLTTYETFHRVKFDGQNNRKKFMMNLY